MQEQTETIFECDPYKNADCSKTGCFINGGECHQTRHLKYARQNRPTDYARQQSKQTAEMYAKVETPGADVMSQRVTDERILRAFSTRIRILMLDAGMKQVELSRITGIDQSTLSLVCNRKMKPSAKIVARLAIALGCSADYLLGITNKRTRDEKQTIK